MTRQPIRLLQITDSHLFSNPQKRLLGMDTDASFLAVVDLALQENKHHQLGAILATGDIAQDASARAYLHYKKIIQQFNAPVLWLPGNHDNVDVMRECLAAAQSMVSPCEFSLNNWSIIMLDSSVLSQVYGYLEQDNLDYLQQTLSENQDKHTIVCLHHHPILCGSKWLDGHNLKNADALWDILHQHQHVKALVWGHIHQDFFATHRYKEQSFPCFAPPSTCIQFKPNCFDFELDTLNPGYRWFDLFEDGRLESGVSRTVQSFKQDINSSGY